MIGALGELSPYMLWFCLSMRLKGRVRAIYKSERSTCRSLGTRCFDFYGGKDSIPRVMLITPEPGIKWTIKIWNKKVFFLFLGSPFKVPGWLAQEIIQFNQPFKRWFRQTTFVVNLPQPCDLFIISHASVSAAKLLTRPVVSLQDFVARPRTKIHRWSRSK